jgi:NADPH-dependent 2,4-dienoyl-CoA reductase/sulfur reductase-like enzyme
MSRRILIIGGNAAGVNAANSARKTDSSAGITIIEKEKYSAYSRCGLPFALGGEVPKLEDLQVFPPSHYSIMKIDLRLETTARLVDPIEKTFQSKKRML